LAHLGYTQYLLGNYAEAKTLIERAIQIAEKHDVPNGISDARNYLGQVQIALQDYQSAKQTYVDNLAYSKPNGYLKGIVLALIGAGEAAKLLGEQQEARAYLSEALKTGMESNQIPYVLQALTVMAELIQASGQAELAARLLALVLDHHASYETRSRATRQLAQLESQLSPEIVAAAVDEGGCSTLEDVVRDLLSPQPAASHQPPPAAIGPLGEREVEILQLVANGLSNREVADQLFLATGTVKWYLSEIYTKLYVTSRTQAIARARELNLLIW
jgi:LuxR family maltose regulon positive regulatory protein